MIWRKTLRDLMSSKLRSALVVASIGASVFALGLVIGLSVILEDGMTESHRESLPGHINFWTTTLFDDDVLDIIRREPGVVDAEAQMHLSLRWRHDDSDEWRTAVLVGRTDFIDQRMDLVFLESGRWPGRRELAVERQSVDHFGMPVGGTVIADLGNRTQRLPIVGSVRMPFRFFAPAPMTGQAVFFATPQTVAWLTGIQRYNQVNITMAEFDRGKAVLLANRVRRRLETAGIGISSQEITAPERHWLQNQLDAAAVLLAVLSAVSVVFSAFLIYNTMAALIAQQTWQIGVMKVLGATGGLLAPAYLGSALVHGILGLALAVPPAMLGAKMLGDWLLRSMMGGMGTQLSVIPAALAVQGAVAVTVPLVATAIPVVSGVRITPHQAMSTFGLTGIDRGTVIRLASRASWLPRPLAISLRNTLRRKLRTGLSVTALALSGTMFIMVMSLVTSTQTTLNASLATFGFDAILQVDHRYQASRLRGIASRLSSVAAVEIWDRSQALVKSVETEPVLTLWAVPQGSEMFDPTVLYGRAFGPADGRAILVNNKVADEEDIDVGDSLLLEIEGEKSEWQVVGIVMGTGYRRDNFVPMGSLGRETGSINQGTIVVIKAKGLVKSGDLMHHFRRYGVEVLSALTIAELRYQYEAEFALLISLLLAMAVLMVAVGGIVLGGSMLLNVIERRREIAVMRAIGASSAAIVGLFMAEGAFVGLWSWLVAVPLSFPITRSVCQTIGMTIFSAPMVFRYSVSSVAFWLLIVIVVSTLSSTISAARAGRITIREALAYE